MQHATVHTETKWRNARLHPPTLQSKLLGVLSVLIGITIVAMFVLVWTAPTININTLLSYPQVPPGNALGSNTINRNDDTAIFEQSVRDLSISNSPEAFRTLLQFFKSGVPTSQRSFVLTTLTEASPVVVPVLITALNDSDVSVRAGAAQVLGLRRESQAIAPLTAATRDADASVRLEAANALGSLGAWEVSPRLDQLQVNETNYTVRQAAIAAKETYKAEIAQAIGVPFSELRDISVTVGDAPQIYAVTTSNLYALHGTASWVLVSHLPDVPLAIATGANPTLIYLATVSSGLYRSLDGGATWEHVQFGLQTLTQLTVTAVVVNPQDSRQMFIALAAQNVETGVKSPMGIFTNTDGGATWSPLPDSPTNLITTRLVMDPQQSDYLFGMTSDTPWRYSLSAQSCEYCLD